MNIARSLVAIGFTLIMMGCPARSLNHLFTEKDLAFLPGIEGAWGDEKETYTFERSGNGYVITYREYESTGDRNNPENATGSVTYSGKLGKLGSFWFLDSSPKKGSLYDHHLLPVHVISRIWVDKDTLRVSSLESDWLKTMIEEDKVAVSHVRRDNEILLTAPTEELQALVLRHAEDEEAFPNPGVMVRLK